MKNAKVIATIPVSGYSTHHSGSCSVENIQIVDVNGETFIRVSYSGDTEIGFTDKQTVYYSECKWYEISVSGKNAMAEIVEVENEDTEEELDKMF